LKAAMPPARAAPSSGIWNTLTRAVAGGGLGKTVRTRAWPIFQRYIEHLPSSGEIVFFDRSWYNRAGAERVMGFCNPDEYLESCAPDPQLERMLVNSGIHLFKFWFPVSREEQLRRFISRRDDPLKH
jgi:polyphosphate kinase 2 (PPK2 family)